MCDWLNFLFQTYWDLLEMKIGPITWFLSKKWGWKERSNILCIELRGWRTGFLFFLFFGNFFQHVKKLLNFWNFVNIKVAKSKLDHLGFYCKLDFFDRTIRKFRNWNQSWVLINGIPCTRSTLYISLLNISPSYLTVGENNFRKKYRFSITISSFSLKLLSQY